MNFIKRFFAYLLDSISKRMKENKEIKEIERKGYVDARKKEAFKRGQQKAKKDPKDIFRF